MCLVPINISTFRFSPFKNFLRLLVPIKFSITTFGPYFKFYFIFFNKIVHKCLEYCKSLSQKKIEFFNQT